MSLDAGPFAGILIVCSQQRASPEAVAPSRAFLCQAGLRPRNQRGSPAQWPRTAWPRDSVSTVPQRVLGWVSPLLLPSPFLRCLWDMASSPRPPAVPSLHTPAGPVSPSSLAAVDSCTSVLLWLPVARAAAPPAGLPGPAPLPDGLSWVQDAATQGHSLRPPCDCPSSPCCGVPRASLSAPCTLQAAVRLVPCCVTSGRGRHGWVGHLLGCLLLVSFLLTVMCYGGITTSILHIRRPRAGSRTRPPPCGPLYNLTGSCACTSPASSYGPKRSKVLPIS